MEKNFQENFDSDTQAMISEETKVHTKQCAYNMAMRVQHVDCRDCSCHHYQKF